MSRLLLALLLAGAGPAAHAQSDDTTAAADTTAAPSDPGDWLVLPYASYAPDTKISVGATAGYYQNTGGGRPASSVVASFTVTQRRQVIVQITPELYLEDGDWRLYADLQATRFPDSFYGIGGDQPTLAQSYTDQYGQVDLTVQTRIRPNLRVGPRAFVRGGTVTEAEEGSTIDRGSVPGTGTSWTVGAGGSIFWDARDNQYYPTTGTYADVSLMLYTARLGSDFTYGGLRTDLRGYRSPGFGVLAGQVYSEVTAGEAPFQLLPKLGGSNRMRGYAMGRRRDNVYWTVQAEYRVPLFWRFKATTFASVGEVGPRFGPDLAQQVEAAVGIGGRVRLTEDGIHGRADLAYSPTGIELYLSLGEAF
jgi:hypothetical protein